MITTIARSLCLPVICIIAGLATGCDGNKDVTNDPKYGNFANLTGRWKTKETLTLVNGASNMHPDGNALQIWTQRSCDSSSTAKRLATLPPGTQIQVEHLILHPSFEADTYSITATLVDGQYAGQSLELDQLLFTESEWMNDPKHPSPQRNWQVKADQLER